MAVMGDGPMGGAGAGSMGYGDYLAPEAMRGRCMPTSDELARNEPDADWEHVSSAAKELVWSLLQVDPSKRLSAAEAAVHRWTRGISSPRLLPTQVNHMMKDFTTFHRSVKLQRAALTALAMQQTNQQLEDQRELFLAIDSDGNGRISKQELVDSIMATSPLRQQDVRKWAESVFDSVDTDGSNEIDYTEWLAAVAHTGACRSEETMRAAFRVFDADGDGSIDEAEFARVLLKTPQEVADLLPQFDANGDGVIDFEEFKNLLSFGVASSSACLHRAISGLSWISSGAPSRAASGDRLNTSPQCRLPCA